MINFQIFLPRVINNNPKFSPLRVFLVQNLRLVEKRCYTERKDSFKWNDKFPNFSSTCDK